MRGLVAVVTHGGATFVEQMARIWAAGDAVLPIDARLPAALVDQLLAELRPTALIDPTGATTVRADGRSVDAGDAVVIATSGTTGTAKGVVLTHDAVAASAHATSAWLGVDPARHRWLACLPVAHIGGLSVITRAQATGTPLIALPGFDAEAVRAAALSGATHVSLVATALTRVDATAFERILLGGSAAPARMPANATMTYGLTETGSGIWYRDAAHGSASARQGLIDGAELRIVDGNIQVRGPMLLRCYRRRNDDTDPRAADGWFATGDGGSLDDGGLRVDGRLGDLIVTGGQKVWPQIVERALSEHPGVADVLVYGRPDAEWGHAVTAMVVPRDTINMPTVEDLRAFGRDRLAPYALPRAVELVATLPRTALGKLVRHPRP
jgi:O-succinylbenzoic acid--CoA ligase